MKNGNPWPDDTFVWEDGNQEHYCGTHWEPFFDSVEEIFDRLPEILDASALLQTYGDFVTGPHEIPPDWAKGFCLSWPHHDRGLVIPFRMARDTNEFINITPYAGSGIQVSIEMEKVHVWAGGAEAQIDGIWGDLPVTFFDIGFLGNRTWYETGKCMEFILAGIAYHAQAPKINKLELSPDSQLAVWQRTFGGLTEEQSAQISLEGSSIFLHLTDWDSDSDIWDRDDYRFRGPVRSVTAFDDWLGQSGWKARVGVMEFEGKSLDLDIFITERAWDDSEPPRVGQDIEGGLWLQGRLWYPV